MIEAPMGGSDGGRRPVAGHFQKVTLDAEGAARLEEVTELRLRLFAQLREEGSKAPEAKLYWEGEVNLDLSEMSDQERAEVEARIAQIRADPEWRARLKQKLEKQDPDLARLMDV
ncbi:MAG TPA: hypothetical protein VFN18_10925 [Solirubrobacterales bacterium]|nr:hypothetical protein [Solirubrobacterales bacterium]